MSSEKNKNKRVKPNKTSDSVKNSDRGQVPVVSNLPSAVLGRGRGRGTQIQVPDVSNVANSAVGTGRGKGGALARGRGRGRGTQIQVPDVYVANSAVGTGRGKGGAPARGRGRGRGTQIQVPDVSNVANSAVGTGRGKGGAPARGRGRANVLNTANVTTDNRYEQATSTNLPVITYRNVAEYFQQLRVPEQRQRKDVKSSSAEYGDVAIGYVKINRTSTNCVVEARITPETSVNNTPYVVSITVDEVTKNVNSASCNCQASLTNCKHQTALIFWLLRRSEEPSPTDVACYWKKSVLSTVKNIKSKTVDELSNRNTDLLGANDDLLKEFIELGKGSNKDAGVIRYSEHGENMQQTLYMDHLIISFAAKYDGKVPTCDEFLGFCSQQMTDTLCKKIFVETKEQAAKRQWYYLRFGRITASKLYETSRCRTYDGSLVGSLMGSRGFKGNLATKRGQKLETEVFELLKSGKYPRIKKCGIIVRADMPAFGSSPDGIDDDYIFEIKCPSKKKTVKDYIENGVPSRKVYFQMQLQMLMSGRSKGILAVADPEFEKNRKFIEAEVSLNKIELNCVLDKCKFFWTETIFPLLK